MLHETQHIPSAQYLARFFLWPGVCLSSAIIADARHLLFIIPTGVAALKSLERTLRRTYIISPFLQCRTEAAPKKAHMHMS